MADLLVKDTSLTAVANAIRAKTGGSSPINFPDGFVSEIGNIPTGQPPETPTDALLFYSPNEIGLSIYNKTKNWDGTLYYSTDHINWTEYDGTTEIVSTLSDGYHKIYLKGVGNTKITGDSSTYRFVSRGSFIKCVGNCDKLLDSAANPTHGNSTFAYLFYQCSNIDFDIELPATSLNSNDYKGMFYGCTSLTTAPALPATTLTYRCYDSMFYGCTSLTTAPALPATAINVVGVYSSMFYGCISLKSAPELPATKLEDNCYQSMFYGCTSLTTAPALPATTLKNYCYQSMFYGCTSLTTIPALPATTLRNYCYQSMFALCTKIKLSTEQTGEYQTEYRIPISGTGTDASATLNNMFANTGGTFIGTPTINTTYYTSNTVIPAA